MARRHSDGELGAWRATRVENRRALGGWQQSEKGADGTCQANIFLNTTQVNRADPCSQLCADRTIIARGRGNGRRPLYPPLVSGRESILLGRCA